MNKKGAFNLLGMLMHPYVIIAILVLAAVGAGAWYLNENWQGTSKAVTYEIQGDWINPENAVDGDRSTYASFNNTRTARVIVINATFHHVPEGSNVTFVFERYGGAFDDWSLEIPAGCYIDGDVTIGYEMDIYYPTAKNIPYVKHHAFCKTLDGKYGFFRLRGWEPNADKLYELEVN